MSSSMEVLTRQVALHVGEEGIAHSANADEPPRAHSPPPRSSSSKKKKTTKQRKAKRVHVNPAIVTLVMCLIWYISASAAIITSKTVLMHTWAPFTLSFTQFLAAAACGFAVAWTKPRGLELLVVPAAQRWSVARIAACFVAGFLFTNYSFELLAAPTVETIKTAQTVTSVLLTVVCSSATSDPMPTQWELLSMAPIILGVFLATYSEMDLILSGVVSTIIANISFSLRGAVLKQHNFYFRKRAVGVLGVFFWSCALGAVAAGLLALAHGETFSALEGQLSPELQRVERREQLLHVGAALNQRDEIVPERPFDTGMVAVVIANGLLYFAYNYYSFALLNRITFLAHSALNACRRCVIIVIGSLWFHRPITLQNVFGISVAFLGFGLFLWAKSEATRFRNAHAADSQSTATGRQGPAIQEV